MDDLLKMVVGDETLYERYLFDQQFAHQGWSGMVSVVETQPETLLDRRLISLKDLIRFELLLEIDALDYHFDEKWTPLGPSLKSKPLPLFAPVTQTELTEVLTLWQEAFEWLLACLAASGFPITPTFIGEDLIFTHIHEDQLVLALFISLSFVIDGLAIIRIYARVFLGPHVRSVYEMAYRSS